MATSFALPAVILPVLYPLVGFNESWVWQRAVDGLISFRGALIPYPVAVMFEQPNLSLRESGQDTFKVHCSRLYGLELTEKLVK
jgi:hypothetical protein